MGKYPGIPHGCVYGPPGSNPYPRVGWNPSKDSKHSNVPCGSGGYDCICGGNLGKNPESWFNTSMYGCSEISVYLT